MEAGFSQIKSHIKLKYYFTVITQHYNMQHEKFYTGCLVGAMPSLSMREYLQIKLIGASVCIVNI